MRVVSRASFAAFPALIAVIFIVVLELLQLITTISHAIQPRGEAKAPMDKPGSYSYNGRDHPRTLPVYQQEVLLTVEDSLRFSLTGPDAEQEWSSNVPSSFGFVRLGPHQRVMVASMFHQLHCLRMFRWTMNDPSMGVYHAQHCLEYMRKMALCGSDTTLEPQDVEGISGETVWQFSGTGQTHQCRDWSAAYPWIEANLNDWTTWWAARGNATDVYSV